MPTPCYISYHGMRILDKFPRKSHIPSDIYAHPAVSVFDRAFVVVLIKGITLTTFASFAVRVTVGGREVPPTVSSLKGKNVSHNFVNSQKCLQAKNGICYVPVSIADGLPRHLSGKLLKPLRNWGSPNKSGLRIEAYTISF